MVCDNCGSQLNIDMSYCPYCGKENIEAKKHIDDMEKYNSEFVKTKSEVMNRAKWYSRYYGHTVIIAIMVIAIAICIIVIDNIYEIKDASVKEYYINNKAVILEKLNEFYENKDYYGIYCYINSIGDVYDISDLWPYQMIGDAARNSQETYKSILLYLYGVEDNYIYTEDYLSAAAKGIYYFYQYEQGKMYNYDKYFTDISNNALSDMKYELEVFLMVYAGFDEDDIIAVNNAGTLSEINALLMRRLTDEEQKY